MSFAISSIQASLLAAEHGFESTGRRGARSENDPEPPTRALLLRHSAECPCDQTYAGDLA